MEAENALVSRAPRALGHKVQIQFSLFAVGKIKCIVK